MTKNTEINSVKKLKTCPGYPSKKRLRQGRVAVIECIQEIPCDPCEKACPNQAIIVGKPITNLPRLIEDKCGGCGLCIAACPGLAIFVVDNNYSDDEASVSLPYEFLPLPEKGDRVKALNRLGEIVGEARVIKVLDSPKFNKTAVVTITIPKKFSDQIRSFKLK